MALALETPLRELPGIGETRSRALERLGLRTVGDLLHHYPRDYEDRTVRSTFRSAPEGEAVCVAAMVAEPPRLSRIRKGLELIKVKVVDAAGAATLTFFNQSYVKDALHTGETYVFYGKVEGPALRRNMTNPIFEREDRPRFTGRIVPVYALTAGISNNLLAGLVLRCLEDCASLIPECLPSGLRRTHGLAEQEFSIRNVHFPENGEALALARRRLMFEELFTFSCGLALLRERRGQEKGPVFASKGGDGFSALLPFSPTAAQRRAMAEAAADMASGRPMNRLVQGDVGSGKTIVAAYGAWQAAQNGWQAALMAPTEILAEQHFRTLSGLFAPAGIRVVLLTAAAKAAEKRSVKAALAAGEADLVIGTHALLSSGVVFSRLGLVITDEQHRFGVEQRAALAGKAADGLKPHILVMSATPIPRTLALILYGDLDVSVIDELPPGRTPVETFVVGEDKRARMYSFVRKLVEEGRQVYFVCPMVEDGEEAAADLKAVTAYAADLQNRVFSDLRVGLVHGRMKPREKEAAMAAFAAGEMDVLVATTVVEVGVDVPNAALMVVENAERFGLSQLHQLRGRVGRGRHHSYCILMTATRNEESRARLKILAGTTDGFQISEEDLRLRGPGDFFGTRQHGLPRLRVADLAGDMRLLKEAQAAADELLQENPGLAGERLAPLRERIQSLFDTNGDSFN